MAWYDYIPGVGVGVNALKGNWKQAGIDWFAPIGPYIQSRSNAADEQKNGYLNAAGQSQALGERIAGMGMEGLQKAENYYLPAQKMNRAAYGDPGALRK
jgi:hypothetical protein